MSEKQRLKELQAFVTLCFGIINQDRKEIARMTGLHVSTISRLAREEFSTAMHVGTLQRLGAAAGLELVMTRTKATVRLSRLRDVA